jgi:transcriptional regulator with XRE-family HTH domain
MTEKAFNLIFSKNLRGMLSDRAMTQKELARLLKVSETSISSWCRGEKSPRMNKVDAMCKIFGCSRSDLMEDHSEGNEREYYLNAETRKIAQEVYDNPELKILFDASRDATPEDLKVAVNVLEELKKRGKS